MKYVFVFIIFTFLSPLSGQIGLVFEGDYGYWQHTDIYGWNIKTGVYKDFKKFRVNARFGFGYGDRDRISNDKIGDAQYRYTVSLSKFVSGGDLSAFELAISEDVGISDYARQLSYEVAFETDLFRKNNRVLFLGAGLFLCDVYNFQIVKMKEGFELTDHFYIEGPINLAIISNQRFLTAGISGQIGCKLEKGKNFYAIYATAGYGVGKSSFAGLGVKAGGLLQ